MTTAELKAALSQVPDGLITEIARVVREPNTGAPGWPGPMVPGEITMAVVVNGVQQHYSLGQYAGGAWK